MKDCQSQSFSNVSESKQSPTGNVSIKGGIAYGGKQMRSLSLLPRSGQGFILYKSSNSNPFAKEYVIVVITSREAPTEATKVWCQHSEFLEDDQLAWEEQHQKPFQGGASVTASSKTGKVCSFCNKYPFFKAGLLGGSEVLLRLWYCSCFTLYLEKVLVMGS